MHATCRAGDKARVGDAFPTLDLTANFGELITIQHPAGDFVHLQPRRFAGCPVGNLHLRWIVPRNDEIRAPASEAVVLHSTAGELAKDEAVLQFPLIADPERERWRRLASFAAASETRSTKTGVPGPVKPTGGPTGCPTR